MALAQAAPPTGDQAALDCPHADRCPGCPLIALSYEAGLALKAERLERARGRYPELEHASGGAGVQAAASFESYRLRAKLVTDSAGRLGLFAAGSHDVVDIPGCRVQARELADVARALRALLPLELPLRGVDLRLCDGGVLVCLIVEGEPDRNALERVERLLLARLPHVSGLALNIAQPDSVQLLGARLEVRSGAAAQPHHFGAGAPWHYASHGAFTQVHAGQTERLHQRIEVQLGEKLGDLTGRRVLELYAGSGALALRLAARGARVTAVEAFAPALERIALAARAQSLEVETWAGDAEAFLRELAASPPRDAIDAVLVNPPRRGLAASVRSALGKLAPRLISYVSCEPETLARDLALFELAGYRAAALEAFDMIPLSDAVESLALLEPAPAPAPRVLFEDETSLALYKLPFESTSGQGESGFSLLERARRTLGEPALAPVQRLDVGTSGVCWFARRPELVPALAEALARGSETYLALARGITHGKGKIARPLLDGGKRRAALTRYRRVSVVSGHSLLEMRPEHAGKHQLQRHLAAIGHPILGDARYGHEASNRHFEHRFGLDRPFLHCMALTLDRGGGPIEIRAPLAGDLAAVLDAAGGPRGGAL
jgi:tRNA/tmRNA/rRNA uracil-C5-methylase (TrmA/RlmC/RlmD family)/23S rRNA-/tRNA-specific pseudouridylate synthase